MFCDLVGSTELSGRLDPEDLRDVMRSYGRFQLKTNAEEGRELMERALAIFEELSATGWIEETRTALALI